MAQVQETKYEDHNKDEEATRASNNDIILTVCFDMQKVMTLSHSNASNF